MLAETLTRQVFLFSVSSNGRAENLAPNTAQSYVFLEDALGCLPLLCHIHTNVFR